MQVVVQMAAQGQQIGTLGFKRSLDL